MNQNKLMLTPQDILEKEFKIDTRGYRLQEVDRYLDMIINDYNEHMNIIKDKDGQITDLQCEINALKDQIRQMEMKREITPDMPRPREVTNVDLLKRISQLEKIVFGRNDY
jgi:DivIVA domain-containing protein